MKYINFYLTIYFLIGFSIVLLKQYISESSSLESERKKRGKSSESLEESPTKSDVSNILFHRYISFIYILINVLLMQKKFSNLFRNMLLYLEIKY